MNTVTVDHDTLVVEPQGLDKVWSFTRRLEIPVSHVRGATADPGMTHEPKGLRGPGLGLPGKRAGAHARGGEKTFWNVSGSDRAIVIELAGEDFTRLVLTVAEPRATVDAINAAIAA